LNIDIFEIKTPINQLNKKGIEALKNNELYLVEGGTYEIVGKQFPQSICQTAEKMLKIEKCYVMGFKWDDQIYGSLNILMPTGTDIKYPNIIKSFCNLISINLKQRTREEALIKSEKRFDDVAENATEWIWEINTDGLVVYSNQVVQKIMGYKPREIIGKKFFYEFFIDEEKNKLDSDSLKKIFNNVKNLKCTCLHKDGHEVILNISSSGSIDENAKFGGYHGVATDITDQKKSKNEIIISKIKLENALNLAKLVSWEYDGSSKSFIFNDRLYSLFGTTAEAEGGYRMSFEDYIQKFAHPDDVEYLIDGFKLSDELRDSAFGTSLEHRIIRHGGETRYISIQIDVEREIDPSYPRIFGTIQDITDIKISEQSLRESEEKYRGLFDTSPLYVIMLGIDGTILDINAAALKMAGISKEKLVGKKISEFKITTDDQKSILTQKAAELLNKGKVEPFESHYYDRNGDLHNTITNLNPLEMEGKIYAFQVIIDDVTEIMEYKKNLTDSEMKFRNIVETMQEGIWIVDEKDFTSYVNDSMTHMLGYDSSEMLGQPVYDFVFDEDKKEAQKHLEKNRTRLRRKHDFKFKHKNGNAVWVMISTNSIFDEKDEYKGTIGIMTNITQRKHVEDRLKKSLNEKDALLKEIQHRVKNNMQIITSLLSMQMKYAKEEETKEFLMDGSSRVKAMSMIHENLYANSEVSIINFKEYLEKLVADIFYSYGVQKGPIIPIIEVQDMEMIMETALPLGLIINELVTNAIKFAYPDGNGGKIIIKLEKVETEYIMVVQDFGIGLSPSFDIENTFSLGFKIINLLTMQLDGTIELESDHGTKFTIKFNDQLYRRRF
jgi:PAS domain S-box-containing protein